MRLLQTSGAAAALCDVGGVDTDAVIVAPLARLQLAARRPAVVRLAAAPSELLGLVALMGLTSVLSE